MHMNITAIDLDQVGPQERVIHLRMTIILITPWAVANVKACGAKKSIGMVVVWIPILSQSLALMAPGYGTSEGSRIRLVEESD